MNTTKTWILSALAAALVAGAAGAQPAPRVERADQLPRFSYPVAGPLEAIVREPERFAAFAAPLQRDTEQVLATHDIAEAATRRRMLGLLAQLALLQGRHEEALQRATQVRALEEKPAARLMSGLLLRAVVEAARETGRGDGPAFVQATGRRLRAGLDALPAGVVRNDVIRLKMRAETAGEAMALGGVREVLQPVAGRAGALSSDLAPALVAARFELVFMLPLKDAVAAACAGWLAAHPQDKADIWAARDIALPPGRGLAPVTIVVWDSGVDTAPFADRLLRRDGQPAQLAFDIRGEPSPEPLGPMPPALKARLPQLQARSKGLSDLSANIDSPEAAEVRALLAGLAADRFREVREELRLVGNYQHGTHVAGIALAGHPYARLASARIEFGHTLRPDPCPSDALQARLASNMAGYADFIRASGARVVNMSWSGNARSFETSLEQCGIGADAGERRAIARRWFEQQRAALQQAIASLPEVLFVAAAGNAGNDPSFNESYPGGLVLPNLVSVGAVDRAGDEAPFTNYGPTVLLHANGYLVDSVVPGGRRVALSGTSMAAPQVANVAAKMLSVQPSLKPQEIIRILRDTADRSEDGRRTLIHPARALAAVGWRDQPAAARTP